MIEYDGFQERCPKCVSRLREINKDYYPEYINHGSVEGFRHRYVCPRCGTEVIYNTVTAVWNKVEENSIYHYGKNGNRLLYRTSKKYITWMQRNWQEIQEEYLGEIREARQIDEEEFEELEEWVQGLGKKEVLTHIRQIADEISHPDYECRSQPAIAAELILLTRRMEELLDE